MNCSELCGCQAPDININIIIELCGNLLPVFIVAYANPHMGHNMDMMDHDMMGHMGHMGHEGHDMDKMPMNREIDTSFIQFAQKDLKLLDKKYFPKG